ncbi:NADH-quinone oxidoreductase subunit N [Streptomyces sp. ACA25]|uniref:NADH-quinone oxidoreductase subunit N n=1 Tax=Streptomyces sp. ACA25 TaxID=3022596 RepID=UPI002307CEE5|nr:NADH-quinone oxidoreductase subunit N [Streptomyces sp. ACA25]MDB1090352.1 NADH-quinone oxidoreductase subunit N [Streptomyces sp. ACA25]
MNLIQTVDWTALAPPVIAAATALAVVLADLFLPENRKRLLGPLALGGLALAALSLLPLRAGDRTTFCLTQDPGLCSYVADPFTLIIQLLVLGGAFVAALMSLPDLRPGPEEPGSLPRGEFWFLLLASAAGAALLPAARDLATLIIALEVATLPAYALVGLRRGSRNGPEAALKFFLTSVTATAVTLLGISFVYAGAGSLHLTEIGTALPGADPQLATLAEAGVALTLVGFAFKTAAVPFHFWVPDTYLGAPLPVAGYLSVVGKTAGLAGLILVITLAFPAFGSLWGPVVAVLAGLTMTAGNVAALRTRPDAPHSAIRLLAWSSVGQAGYLLVPIAAAAHAADVTVAVGATVAYALMYAVVNLGVFAIAVHVARHHPGHRIADYRGLYAEHPLLALALGFFLLCLAGLPPGLVGLFAKIVVFRSAVDAGLGVLAVVMALNVVVALYYYLQWTAILFRAPEAVPEDAAPRPAAAETPEAPTAGTAVGTGPATPDSPAAAVTTDTAAALPVRPLAAPLAAAVALTAGLGILLSGAPQLILRFASEALL